MRDFYLIVILCKIFISHRYSLRDIYISSLFFERYLFVVRYEYLIRILFMILQGFFMRERDLLLEVTL